MLIYTIRFVQIIELFIWTLGTSSYKILSMIQNVGNKV